MSSLFLSKPRAKPAHDVKEVFFLTGIAVDKCPVECSCGWSGKVGEWPEHAPGTSVSRAWGDDAKYNGPRHRIPHTRLIGRAA